MKVDRFSQEKSPDQMGPTWSPQDPTASAAPMNAATRSETRRFTGLELWIHRLTMLLFVFVCAVVGVLLVILPWRPQWTDNRLLLIYPGIRAFIANGFVRGVCTGLGLLDIVIGFWEATHYHEGRPA